MAAPDRRFPLLWAFSSKPWACNPRPRAKSAFITGLATVMVPLLAALVYRNRPRVSEWFGVSVATLGMGLMTLGRPIRFHQPRRPADASGRGGVRGTHRDPGTFFGDDEFELLSVAQVGARPLSVRWPCSGGWNPSAPLAAGCGLGDTDHRTVVHCHGVYHPGVGAAVHDFHPHRPDLRSGTCFRLDHVVGWFWVKAVGPRRYRRCVDFGRRPAGGNETVSSAVTSI